MDVDKSFLDGIDELVPKFPQYEEQIRAYYLRWEEMIVGEFPGTVKILRELKEACSKQLVFRNLSTSKGPV